MHMSVKFQNKKLKLFNINEEHRKKLEAKLINLTIYFNLYANEHGISFLC